MTTPAHLATLTGKLGGLTPGRGNGYELEEHTLTAIVGGEGATPTEGWAKWAEVQRRQRTSITNLEGYPPYTITLPLLMDAGSLGLEDVEGLVAILEWFGGRGPLFQNKPGAPGVGEPPLIELASDSGLIPAWMQSAKGREGTLYYVLQNPIDYNMLGREWLTPIRKGSAGSGAGKRLRQAANLTLLQYEGTSADTSDSVANRVNILRKQEETFQTFTVGDNINTFSKIAGHFNRADPAQIPQAAKEIQQANTKYGASVKKNLPRGAKIRVPESATSKRF
jgi:hypothetical protein